MSAEIGFEFIFLESLNVDQESDTRAKRLFQERTIYTDNKMCRPRC